MAKEKNYSLLSNSRFYILASSFLLSVAVVSWLRLQISSDQLFYIRAEQIFALLCVFYWYFALVISPVGYIIGKQRTKHIEFARRAIGVSAFYFALLHAVTALWGQLGGLNEVKYLPSLFKWSLLGGLIALCILLIMAATSFDRVVRFMTFRWWKWLHRLVYFGGILAVLHIWTIGTHLASQRVQLAALFALVVLSGLELFRVTTIINRKYLKFNKTEAATVFISLWAIVVIVIILIPVFVQNYHGRHTEHTETQHKSAGHH